MQRIKSLKLFAHFLSKEDTGKRQEIFSDIETQNSFFEKRRNAEKIMQHENEKQLFNDKLLRNTNGF